MHVMQQFNFPQTADVKDYSAIITKQGKPLFEYTYDIYFYGVTFCQQVNR